MNAVIGTTKNQQIIHQQVSDMFGKFGFVQDVTSKLNNWWLEAHVYVSNEKYDDIVKFVFGDKYTVGKDWEVIRFSPSSYNPDNTVAEYQLVIMGHIQ